MRVLFIKQATDWATLAPRLLGTGGDAAQTLTALQRANPHLDFQKIGDGAVLLLPELPGLKAAGAEDDSVGVEAFAGLHTELNDGLADTATAVRSGWAELLTEQREVGVALKKAITLIGSDPDLLAQAKQAQDAVKNDAAGAKAADASLKLLQAQIGSELSDLARMLGGTADKPTVKGGVKTGAAGRTKAAGKGAAADEPPG